MRCNHDHPTHARTVEAGVYKSHEHSAHATVTFTHSGGSAYLPGVPTVAIEMRGFLLQDCRALWEKILSGTITPDISFGKFDPARDHLQGYPSQEAEEDALAAGGRAAEHGTRPE
ncbi:hypothetical protein HQ524_04315 [Candidatus Uhrbacteria bacterium]|nr:hypothetical protein [Candidatus Uhrbacteria bacterium]